MDARYIYFCLPSSQPVSQPGQLSRQSTRLLISGSWVRAPRWANVSQLFRCWYWQNYNFFPDQLTHLNVNMKKRHNLYLPHGHSYAAANDSRTELSINHQAKIIHFLIIQILCSSKHQVKSIKTICSTLHNIRRLHFCKQLSTPTQPLSFIS